MDISALASGATAADVSKAANSQAKLADDFSSFLTLLTTQLQNQDPTEPMDSNEFTQQLVQFSSVEQQIIANQNLEALGTQLQASSNAAATSYLGKSALLQTNQGHFDGQQANWNYSMPESAYAAAGVVRDAGGNVVYEGEVDGRFGVHAMQWDGTTTNGQTPPAGEYSLQIVAFDADGNEIKANVQSINKITEVNFAGAVPQFTAGSQTVTSAEILKLILEG